MRNKTIGITKELNRFQKELENATDEACKKYSNEFHCQADMLSGTLVAVSDKLRYIIREIEIL